MPLHKAHRSSVKSKVSKVVSLLLTGLLEVLTRRLLFVRLLISVDFCQNTRQPKD